MIVLGARTDFSFMRGFGTAKQWLARTQELKTPALAITDYCSTWGHTSFADAFAKSGTKLLFGVQLPVVSVLEKDPRHDLVSLIARNGGLRALYEAVGVATKQTYYRPRLSWLQVEQLVRDGVVHAIVNEASLGSLQNMQRIPGLYFGARPVRDNMLRLLRMREALVVPAPMPTMPRNEDRDSLALVQAISQGHRIGELDASNLPLLTKQDYSMMMRAAGVEPTEEWFENAERIASECCVDFPRANKIKIARDRDDGIAQLFDQCRVDAALKGINLFNGPYADRLNRELEVIREKDFADYFLFVADLVSWARERMFVGPARGSSAGSLLCYLLGITTVDPLKFGTLFERFIDITRPDWPDIDVDFPDDRRDEVFKYLKEKYGADRFARLGTISEFGGKSAINDTAKACGVDYQVARELGKVVEGYVVSGQQRLPLDKIFETDTVAMRFLEKYPVLRRAASIEDHARHHGVHAAGVVISREPITTYGALDQHDTIAMDMKQAERVGLIKMDALGLRTLSVIQEACDLVGLDPRSLYDLDWRDEAVFRLFNNDRVTGVFQFEGSAVRQLMRQIKVEKFDDLAALTSLARPGPLVGGAAATWCDRRGGKSEWDFKHPALAPHLGSTYGTIVYQEQAMQVVRDLGGFDEPSVNGFRRAVGKKDPEKLRSYEAQFLAGCKTWHQRAADRQPIPDEVAQDLWDEMCEFGSYAFNLSHAVAYSMISYMAAWLKVNHPLEYAAACLSHAADEEQAKNLLRELVDEGYEYVPFDPHRSLESWSIQDGRIYGGFTSVKGIGSKTARTLMATREKYGPSWLDELTDGQRDRILSPDNTPWHSLSYFGRKYGSLYENPEAYRSKNTPAGVSAPVYRIKDIPAHKGKYRFLGRIVRKIVKDANAPEKVAKRGGQVYRENSTFVNLIFADDTGEIGTTINRFKVDRFGWLLESSTVGRDFLVRGDIIGDGKWVFIEDIVELTTEEDQ